MSNAPDFLLPLRKACVRELRAYAPLTALIGAGRVYDEVPENVLGSYVRYGVPVTTRFEASAVEDGVEADLTLHCFDQAHDNDRIHGIMNAVKNCLDEAELDLPSPLSLLWLSCTAASLVPARQEDAPQDRHGIVSFTSAVGKLEG